MNPASRIALGTAQFGLDYGVTNATGRIAEATAAAVLARARELGIRWLDTAAAYGSAEAVLGRLAGADSGWRICTKVASASDGDDAVGHAQRQFSESLARLGRSHVELLMIHDAQQLLGEQGATLYDWLAQQKKDSVAQAIGASVYDGAQALRLVERYALDWVQLPLNILDQRPLHDGTLAQLKRAGVKVQVRSALLQGLLLADPQRLPPEFAAARAPLARLRDAAGARALTPLQLALGFVAQVVEVDLMVLGVESPAQLDGCAAALAAPANEAACTLTCNDLDVIDPRRWPAGVRITH